VIVGPASSSGFPITILSGVIPMAITVSFYRGNVGVRNARCRGGTVGKVDFIDKHIPFNELGRPWHLAPYQRDVLDLMFQKHYPLRCWSEPKKSGKSHITECVALAEAITDPGVRIGIFANDSEQASSIIFNGIRDLIRQNRDLRTTAKILAKVIRFSNGSEIEWYASDYQGGAGHRRKVSIIDEPWALISERAHRLFEELLPIPTIPDSYLWLCTTAGFSGEGSFLEDLYRRGIQGKRLDEEYEVYQDAGLCMFWSHTPRQPWQTEQFYDEQRRLLRPNSFARQHENKWISSEQAFVTREQWMSCVNADHRPSISRWTETFWGLDIGIKSDNAAVVGVSYDGNRITILDHRVWRPSKGNPVSIQEIEDFLRSLRGHYRVKKILADPWQAASLIQRLQRNGFGSAITEYPQTPENLTVMTEELFRLITSRNLIAYADPEIMSHVLNAVTLDSSRGVRLAKEKASRKIDLCVALAMACAAAVEHGQPVRSYAFPTGRVRKNPFGAEVFGRRYDTALSPGFPVPLGVGSSGWSLGGDDDDDYYVGAKPVR
jgi:phage terminase large subunit-like protein